MTEEEWHGSNNPEPMLEYLSGRASARKLRLFACACYRHIGPFLGKRTWNAIEFAERHADGLVTDEQLHGNAWGRTDDHAAMVCWKPWDAAVGSSDYCIQIAAKQEGMKFPEAYSNWKFAFDKAWQDGASPYESLAAADACSPVEWLSFREAARDAERLCQSHALRDLFGPGLFDSCAAEVPRQLSLESSIVKYAEAIYETHAFDALPDLASELPKSIPLPIGVTTHLRQGGVHVRGCWALDLILGKE